MSSKQKRKTPDERKEEERAPKKSFTSKAIPKKSFSTKSSEEKPVARRLPVVRKQGPEDTFSNVLVPLLRESKAVLESYARPTQEARLVLRKRMANVAAVVSKLTDKDVVSLRQEHYRLENEILSTAIQLETKTRELRAAYEKEVEQLELERDQKLLEESSGSNDSDEEEAVLQVLDPEVGKRIQEDFQKKIASLQQILEETLLENLPDIQEDKPKTFAQVKSEQLSLRDKLAKLKREQLELQNVRAVAVYRSIYEKNAELSEAIAKLYQAKNAFPGRPKELSKEDLEFIKKTLSIPVPKAEKEKLPLYPPKSKEVPENFIQKALDLLNQLKISPKEFAEMREGDEDRVKRRRVRSRGGRREEDGSDVELSEEDVLSESESESEEEREVNVIGDVMHIEEDAQKDKAPKREELLVQFSVAEPLGYLDGSDVEEEIAREEVDSEQEEEPKDVKVAEKRVVAQVEHRGIPLTKGEKLLQNIPFLSLSDARYKQVKSEIEELRRESSFVSRLYRDLEQNVAKPFVDTLGLPNNILLGVLQNNYNGKEFTGHNFSECFDLTDEQKLLTKHLFSNSRFIKDVEEMLKEPRVSIFDNRLITTLSKDVEESKYIPFLQRILGKARVIAVINGTEPSLPREQEQLISKYVSRMSQAELQAFEKEVKEEEQFFLNLQVPEKVLAGIPVLKNVSPTLFGRYVEITRRLNSMVYSEYENKTDYPFTTSYEQIAEYIPSLLLQVFVQHRKEIADTRPVFVRKFILSRLSVEQYIYVKVFMGHPESSLTFSTLLSQFTSALRIANSIEQSELKEVESIVDPDMKERVVQMLDHSLSVSLNSIFEKQQTTSEYLKLFRQRVPSGMFHKTEYTFLTNCRYAFRNHYGLSFPVIGSVSDMRIVEKVYNKVKDNLQDWAKIQDMLQALNQGLMEESKEREDVNKSYQEDLVKAMVEQLFLSLVQNSISETVQLVDQNKDPKQIAQKLKELDELLQRRLGDTRSEFGAVKEALAEGVFRVKFLAKKQFRVDIILDENLSDLIAERKTKRLYSPLWKMIKSLKKTPSREVPAKRMEVTEKVEPLYNILRQMRDDSSKRKLLSLEDYQEMYTKTMPEKDVQLDKKAKQQRASKRFEERRQIEKLHAKLSSPGFDYVRMEKYAVMPDSKEAYKWKDRGVLRVHAELMRLMPNYLLDPKTVPLEWCGLAQAGTDFVKPSVYLFHTIENSDVEVHPDGMIVDGKPVSLFLTNSLFDKPFRGLRPATTEDYNKIVHAVDIKSVMDAFNHSELVVIPSQVDRQMVFPFASDSLFFPGFEKQVESKKDLEEKLASLLKRKEESAKTKLRIEQLQQEIDIESQDIPLDGLEKVYRLRLLPLESELEPLLKQKAELNEQLELLGEDEKVVEQLSEVSRTIEPIMAKLAKIRQDYIKQLQKSKLDEMEIERRIEQVEKEKEKVEKVPKKVIDLGKKTIVRKDELDIVNAQLAELFRLKEIQKERFVRQHEIQRLELRKQLLSEGWMRPTIHLVREMYRVGRSEGMNIRVNAISYQCAIIYKGRLTPVSGEEIIEDLGKYYTQRLVPQYSEVLESFVPIQAEEESDVEMEFLGARDAVCANCKKTMKKVWRNTVQLIDGQPRIVPLCSEHCSEEYHPNK